MRVTFVFPAYFAFPIGGYRIIYEYANFLADQGHRVTVVFPKPPRSENVISVLKRKAWPGWMRIKHRPLVNWQWIDPRVKLSLVESLDPRCLPPGDAVVATAWQTAGPVAALPPQHGEKFYLIQHYEIWDGPEAEVNATWRLPMRLAVISQWLYEIGQSLGAERLRHIPNAIDHRQFKVLTPIQSRPPHVISLYHKTAFKGVPDALDVFARFHLRHPDVPVTMFGTPERGADIPDWLQYHKNPRQEALAHIYNQGTVYVSASLVEGWSLPPAEAMACGCAFVGTDSGGCRDYAQDGVTALLSPPGDRDALLNNLCRIIEDASLARRIQAAGTALIEEFTWDRSGKMLEAYLMEGAGLPEDSSAVMAEAQVDQPVT